MAVLSRILPGRPSPKKNTSGKAAKSASKTTDGDDEDSSSSSSDSDSSSSDEEEEDESSDDESNDDTSKDSSSTKGKTDGSSTTDKADGSSTSDKADGSSTTDKADGSSTTDKADDSTTNKNGTDGQAGSSAAPVILPRPRPKDSRAHSTARLKGAQPIPKKNTLRLTKKTFKVSRLIDRVEKDGIVRYRVVWDQLTPGKAPVDTWEPEQTLLADCPDLREMMDKVDKWRESCPKASTRHLIPWLTKKKLEKGYTASPDKQCFLSALQRSVSLAGLPDSVLEDVFSRCLLRASQLGVDFTHGFQLCYLRPVAFFINRRLRDFPHDAQLDVDRFTTNLIKTGTGEFRHLPKHHLEDGIYLNGAFNNNGLGHCFVCRIDHGLITVFDEGQPSDWERYSFLDNFTAVYCPRCPGSWSSSCPSWPWSWETEA